MKLTLIKTQKDIINNIKNFEDSLKKDSERHEAIELIRRGQNFIAYKVRGHQVTKFIPSRFVGYVNNNISKHSKAKEERLVSEDKGLVSGLKTSREISKILDKYYLGIYNDLYYKYCKSLDVEPTKNKKRFWERIILIDNLDNNSGYENDLLDEDTLPNFGTVKPEIKEKIRMIRKRNGQIVKSLKKLYNGNCQITGNKYSFEKEDGETYSEVHHLIPLGKDGSDSYENIIVVNPLIHRMLHFAKVSGIDLSKIRMSKLKININEKEYEITWDPKHMETIVKSLRD